MKDDVSRLVKLAAEAAKEAPEHLQEAAFNKAFDALMAGGQNPSLPTRQTPASRKNAHKKGTAILKGEEQDSLDQLDRTAHADINHKDRSLNNSLRLLLAAKEDLGVDGLSAAQITRILVDKFRCRISRQAVSMALNGAGNYVNRHKEGALVIFQIMAPGEEYLAGVGKKPAEKSTTTGGRSPKKKTKKSVRKAEESKKTSSPRKAGSFAAVTQLHAEDFFSSPRTIGDIIKHLKEQYGRTYKSNEISPALLRDLRAKKLTRARNAENQYEYKKA